MPRASPLQLQVNVAVVGAQRVPRHDWPRGATLSLRRVMGLMPKHCSTPHAVRFDTVAAAMADVAAADRLAQARAQAPGSGGAVPRWAWEPAAS